MKAEHWVANGPVMISFGTDGLEMGVQSAVNGHVMMGLGSNGLAMCVFLWLVSVFVGSCCWVWQVYPFELLW